MQPAPFGRRASAFQPRLSVAALRSAVVKPAPEVRAHALDRAFAFLFSTKGRVPRWHFRLFNIGLVVTDYAVVYVLKRVQADLLGDGFWYGLAEFVAALVVLTLGLWCSVVVTIKRWHDLGKSGYWAWLGVVPVVGWIWQAVMCWRVGMPGPNRYGPAPR